MPKPTTRAAHRTATAPRTIPIDTEPLTAADLKAIREADEAFASGDYTTLDEIEADLKADVARLRTHQDRKRPAKKVSR